MLGSQCTAEGYRLEGLESGVAREDADSKMYGKILQLNRSPVCTTVTQVGKL